jgi:hypothetical protein
MQITVKRGTNRRPISHKYLSIKLFPVYWHEISNGCKGCKKTTPLTNFVKDSLISPEKILGMFNHIDL